MKILIDGDACPVIRITENIAEANQIAITIFCDIHHKIESDYSKIVIVDSGPDAVDFALISHCEKQDLVITQDYGLASLVLMQEALALHPNGWQYTKQNIETLLLQRYLSRKERMCSHRYGKGPQKRTSSNDKSFAQTLKKILKKATS